MNEPASADPIDYDRAIALVQQFLGDFGVVDTSEPGHARVTDDEFIIRFRTAADALHANSVVLVDRRSGATRYATVDPDEPDPWPGAKPATA